MRYLGLTMVIAGAIGAAVVTFAPIRDEAGSLTGWGWLAIVVMLFSAVVAVYEWISKEAKEEEHRANLERGFERVLAPLTRLRFAFVFTIDAAHELVNEYWKRLRSESKPTPPSSEGGESAFATWIASLGLQFDVLGDEGQTLGTFGSRAVTIGGTSLRALSDPDRLEIRCGGVLDETPWGARALRSVVDIQHKQVVVRLHSYSMPESDRPAHPRISVSGLTLVCGGLRYTASEFHPYPKTDDLYYSEAMGERKAIAWPIAPGELVMFMLPGSPSRLWPPICIFFNNVGTSEMPIEEIFVEAPVRRPTYPQVTHAQRDHH